MTKTNKMSVDFMVEMKIAGQAITVDLAKVDESWLRHALTYGVRRFVNDSHSAAKGNDKYEACRLMVDDMISGEPMPEKATRSTGASIDPVMALALKNAKVALQSVFKQVTGETKALAFAEHEKIKAFYSVKDDKATWNDQTVIAWMEKQKSDGGVDYLAQAKDTISGAADALKGLDF